MLAEGGSAAAYTASRATGIKESPSSLRRNSPASGANDLRSPPRAQWFARLWGFAARAAPLHVLHVFDELVPTQGLGVHRCAAPAPNQSGVCDRERSLQVAAISRGVENPNFNAALLDRRWDLRREVDFHVSLPAKAFNESWVVRLRPYITAYSDGMQTHAYSGRGRLPLSGRRIIGVY